MLVRILLALAFVTMIACDSKAEEPSGAQAQAATEKAPEAKAAKKADTIAVSDEGAKIDPEVTVDKLPDGAWYCEMGGKSHYARGKKGDGKCPVCGMALNEKKGAAHGKDDGHGH